MTYKMIYIMFWLRAYIYFKLFYVEKQIEDKDLDKYNDI